MTLLGRLGHNPTLSEVAENAAARPPIVTSTLNRLGFGARTRDRWITGYVNTPCHRLGDVLNSEGAGEALLAEDVVIGDRREAAGDTSEYAIVNLSSVLFVVAVDDSAPPRRDTFAWVKKRREGILVGVGPYEIVGDCHVVDGATLRNPSALSKFAFIVITSAVIRQRGQSGPGEQHGTVFVNRQLVDFMVPAR